ncbi:hypothetical protein BDW69DRAFT_92694 [Aspergillus filifer]
MSKHFEASRSTAKRPPKRSMNCEESYTSCSPARTTAGTLPPAPLRSITLYVLRTPCDFNLHQTSRFSGSSSLLHPFQWCVSPNLRIRSDVNKAVGSNQKVLQLAGLVLEPIA